MRGLRFATLFATLVVSACAGGNDYVVIGGARVPSTAGLLTVDADEGSSELELTMEFLPAPQTLSHKLTHYVAWILPTQGDPVRLGALHYVARERTASLSAKGIGVPYTVVVTAESSATPSTPSAHVVSETAVSAN